MNELICYCKNITKGEVDNAILNGAKTLKDIQSMTGACTGNQCKELNPLGVCCSNEINGLLNKSVSKNSNSCSCCK